VRNAIGGAEKETGAAAGNYLLICLVFLNTSTMSTKSVSWSDNAANEKRGARMPFWEHVTWLSVVRSLTIPLFFAAIRYFWKANYSSPRCLLSLLNSTEPAHYQAHPFYHGVSLPELDSTSSGGDCRSFEEIKGYVDMQYEYSEAKIFQAVMFLMGLVATYCGYSVLREVLSVKFVFAALLVFQISVLDMSYAHFGQDILYLCGNIMHHANIEQYRGDESNATFVAMMPQGFAMSSVATFLWAQCVRYVMLKHNPRLANFISPKALVFATFLALAAILFKVKTNHPLMHEMIKQAAANGTDALEAMKKSNPFEFDSQWGFNWRAYQHVMVHHGNGDAFGPSICFDWIFSYALYGYSYLHNSLLKLQIGTPGHYFFVLAFDVALGLFSTAVYWVYFSVAELVFRHIEKARVHEKVR